MEEAGQSAERRAAELRATGDRHAGAWAAGALGEQRTAAALAHLSPVWTVLHDRLLRPGIAGTNIDHIVVGPAGIFAIDTKNRAGDITVTADGIYQLTRTNEGYARTRYLQNDLNNVIWTAREMARLLGAPVMPVLCLAGQRSSQMATGQSVRNVSVVGVDRLVAWLETQPQRMDAEFRTAWVEAVVRRLPSATLHAPTPIGSRARVRHPLPSRPRRPVHYRSGRTYRNRRASAMRQRLAQPTSVHPPPPRPSRVDSCLPAVLATLCLVCLLLIFIGISVIGKAG